MSWLWDDHSNLYSDIQDDPVYWWPEKRLDELIEPFVERWGIDLVVTFDSTFQVFQRLTHADGGVSGHINHRAVSAALNYLSENKPGFPPVYMNVSIFGALR